MEKRNRLTRQRKLAHKRRTSMTRTNQLGEISPVRKYCCGKEGQSGKF
jgi:hypothetical protein